MNKNSAELLQQMIDIKKDIRTAIGNKGVTVVSGMESYPSAIDKIQQEINGSVKLPDGTKFSESTFTSIPLFDTGAMTNMKGMFSLCKSLTTIPQLDTSNVTNMSYMFEGCKSLTTIPQLDTSNVTNMSYMFEGCSNLTTIPQLDTSKVISIVEMFRQCESLNSVPALNCGSAKYVHYMFSSCPNLENIGGLIDFGKSIHVSEDYMFPRFLFVNCFKLTRQSCLNIFNTIYDRKANGMDILTLYFEPEVFDKLLPDDIAIATNKGWTVTSL